VILRTDSPGRSANAIYTIWKRKKTKTYFPTILDTMGMSQVADYMNRWLFRTGYIKDWEYSAEYAVAENMDLYEVRRKLSEIFSAGYIDAE